MTTDQMKAAFGMSPVRIPATFLACVSASTPVTLTHLNITYRNDT